MSRERPWTDSEIRFAAAWAGTFPPKRIAHALGRPVRDVVRQARRGEQPISRRVPWTDAERQFVRDHAGELTVPQIAERLGRTPTQVYRMRARLGLMIPRVPMGAAFAAYLRDHHRAGWSDAEIAAGYSRQYPGRRPMDRHTVGTERAKLGLPENRLHEYQRRRVAAKTAEQLQAAGLPSLAAVRAKAFRDYARSQGWPEDLRPRAVQILNAIWDRGPMTRRELARAIGMPDQYDRPHGEASVLASNDPEGSYLAHLAARGLVVVFKRAGRVTGRGKGRSVDVYSLPIDIKRRKVAQSA